MKTFLFQVYTNRAEAKTYGTITCHKVLDTENNHVHKSVIAGTYWKQYKPNPSTPVMTFDDCKDTIAFWALPYGTNFFFTVTASTQKSAIEQVKKYNPGATEVPYEKRASTCYGVKRKFTRWWSYTFF